MNEEQKARLLAILKATMPKDDIVGVTLDAFGSMPTPSNVEDADYIAIMHNDFMATALGCAILNHISDHGGEHCAKDILEYHLLRLHRDVITITGEGCIECDLENPFKASDLNAKTAADILRECSKDA